MNSTLWIRGSIDAEVAFEKSLVLVLAYANCWFADQNKLLRLRSLCLSKSSHDLIDQLLKDWQEPLEIHFNAGTDGEFTTAIYRGGWLPLPSARDNWSTCQYNVQSLAELKQLLSRFPVGATFRFPSGILSDPMAEKLLFEDLQTSLALKSQKLVKRAKLEE